MDKILEALRLQAEHGDENADRLYWAVKDAGISEQEFPLWVAQNAQELSSALKFKSVMEDATEEEKALQNEFTKLRNQGTRAFMGDGKSTVTGAPQRTLDDFMGESGFGVLPSDGDAFSDDDRAAFTNPENSAYWGNRSADDIRRAAWSLGYQDEEQMRRDLERAGNQFQHAQAVEGYDANNSIQPIDWAVSALKGFAAPRIKEAQLAGRDVTWQDVAGDLAELGLNFVPGVGLVGKGGKVVARFGRAGEAIGRGVPLVVDQFAVPAGTQAIDAGLLYNPNMLGTETSGLNPRSEIDLGKMAAQAGGIATAKGAIKGAGMVGKNMLEQGMGNETGGEAFRGAVKAFESIGEKTDDLIARRQAMLDRKAELAKQRQNVTLPGDRDVSNARASVDDLYNADNFRILTEEADRIAKSSAERDAYRQALAAERVRTEAYNKSPLARLNKTIRGYQQAMDAMADDPEMMEALRKNMESDLAKLQEEIASSPNPLRMYSNPARAETGAAGGYEDFLGVQRAYQAANEAGAKEIVQLPDGRFIYADRLERGGVNSPKEHFHTENLSDEGLGLGFPDDYRIEFPGADYTLPHVEGIKGVPFIYEKDPMSPGSMNVSPYNGTLKDGLVVSRNPAVLAQIEKDELLKRKLDPSATAFRENVRDIGANIGFNGLVRQGVIGNVTDFDRKREQALWNSTLRTLSPLVADFRIPPAERQANADAIMDVMTYGLDGIPAEKFASNPSIYRAIAERLGVRNWKHFSEYDAQPETSYSTSPTSSSSAY